MFLIQLMLAVLRLQHSNIQKKLGILLDSTHCNNISSRDPNVKVFHHLQNIFQTFTVSKQRDTLKSVDGFGGSEYTHFCNALVEPNGSCDNHTAHVSHICEYSRGLVEQRFCLKS